MSATLITTNIAKPFLKWAGGKTQLLPEIISRLPQEMKTGEIATYIEPFVGGGAVFFYIVNNFPKIKHFYLCDINQDLVNCYNSIKDSVSELVTELKKLEDSFLSLNQVKRKDFFYFVRDNFNQEKQYIFSPATAAKLIFLNRTCFNGLYRVNRSNKFNVPFGDYKNPTICDDENLEAVSEVLQKAEILCGDFTCCKKHISKRAFVYFDPPYRPISKTASFTSYAREDFSEKDQVRLAEFCALINSIEGKFLLSNSDPKNENPEDHFFEVHYGQIAGFQINRVDAIRAINCIGNKRGAIKELIITNYASRMTSGN